MSSESIWPFGSRIWMKFHLRFMFMQSDLWINRTGLSLG
jgi:hypothetical protein